MTPKEFISYVDELPAECIEERTAEKNRLPSTTFLSIMP